MCKYKFIKKLGEVRKMKNDNYKDFEMKIKLHINQKLYEKGQITAEMYTKAKEMIYRLYK